MDNPPPPDTSSNDTFTHGSPTGVDRHAPSNPTEDELNEPGAEGHPLLCADNTASDGRAHIRTLGSKLKAKASRRLIANKGG